MGSAVAGWQIEVSAERWRDATGPDGVTGRRSDSVVCLRRPLEPPRPLMRADLSESRT